MQDIIEEINPKSVTPFRNNPPYSSSVILYEPLIISPEDFFRNYTLDISSFVERHDMKEKAQSKGGNKPKRDIKYMSYSHAIRLLRTYHPDFEVDCVVNPLTGGYLFEEIDRRGYFVKAFIHDGKRRSAAFYNAVLTVSGQGLFPDDAKTDYDSKKPKTLPNGSYVYTVDSQLINKTIYRAYVKAIALVTGIGLSLWTGEDLDEEVFAIKDQLVLQIGKLAAKYTQLTGQDYTEAVLLSRYSPEEEIRNVGRQLQATIKELEQSKLAPAQVTVTQTAEATAEVELVSE